MASYGNSYSQMLRSPAKALFLRPHDFLQAAAEYFEWAEDTPLQEENLFHYQGGIFRAEANKARAFSKGGLCSYLGIPTSRLDTYRQRGGRWKEAVEMVEQIIYLQKFEHAAAGLLNANIISRDLGLAEKKELTGADGAPIEQVVQYQLPDNGRGAVDPIQADALTEEDE